MDQYTCNSASHNIDVWCKSYRNGVRIRKREFELYILDDDIDDTDDDWVYLPGYTIDMILVIYASRYHVEEWVDCPELLNKYIRIPIDVEEVRRSKDKSYWGPMHDLIQQNITGPMFIRTSGGSPKDVLGLSHLNGECSKPMDNARDIMYAIAMSNRCWPYIDVDTKYRDKYLWLASYHSLSDKHHFRVFVRDCRVTAIPQYDLLPTYHDENVLKNGISILWSKIVDQIPYTDATIDVVEVDDNIFKILEFNEFGASSRAGSALYNWMQDFITLYSANIDIRLNDK